MRSPGTIGTGKQNLKEGENSLEEGEKSKRTTFIWKSQAIIQLDNIMKV